MRFAPSVVLVDVDCHLAPADVSAVAAALQRQVLEHFSQSWSVVCSVRAATPTVPARPDEIQIRLVKVPTMAGALGYHDVTDAGVPIAYVFPELVDHGDHWSSVASHELLELLGDPGIHLCVELDNGTIWDLEACDRVESSSYLIDGVQVSNFNTRDAFEPPKKGARYDWLGLSTAPNQILPGGYAQRFDRDAGWTMVGMQRGYRKAVAAMGLSRGARRRARTA